MHTTIGVVGNISQEEGGGELCKERLHIARSYRRQLGYLSLSYHELELFLCM